MRVLTTERANLLHAGATAAPAPLCQARGCEAIALRSCNSSGGRRRLVNVSGRTLSSVCLTLKHSVGTVYIAKSSSLRQWQACA